MKFLLFLILSLSAPSAFSEEKTQDIVIGKILTIHSKILNQDKDIWLYVPPNRPSFDFETPKYPVVYFMGDYYLAIGEKQKAIDSFKRALSLGGWPGIKQKLEGSLGNQ